MDCERKDDTNGARAVDPGMLPAWGVRDMPEPRPFNLRNILLVVGPGAIALSLSLGGGEWLLGPAVTLKYSVALLWITLVAVSLQAILNMEFARYTLATGEPIFTGFMRTKPGPKLWGPFYVLLGVFNVAWPAWATASAAALFAAFAGRLPAGSADARTISLTGMGLFLLAILIVMFGGRIERTLEVLSTVIVLFIIGYLLVVCLYVASPELWGRTAAGFFRFGYFPKGEEGVRWELIVAFAAFSGAGGLGNCWITNWLRDKGFGMGATVGFIPGIIAGKKINLPEVGNTFPATAENLSRWKVWWRYLIVDQGFIFGVGCLVGMFLPVLAANAIIPHGEDITGLAAGSYQARHLAELGGPALWFLTLFVGFWILFSTQLALVDGFSRTVTDILWTASPPVRRFRGGDVRYVYYGTLILFAVWGSFALWLARPFWIVVIGANIGALIFVIAGVHVLFVNHRFLPKEIRPPLWRKVAVSLCVLFYLSLLVMVIAG
jgi:Mn2+/Fe2+ NRAMP family transporter